MLQIVGSTEIYLILSKRNKISMKLSISAVAGVRRKFYLYDIEIIQKRILYSLNSDKIDRNRINFC